LNIRAGHRDNDEEKTIRYINGMRYEIQYEINMMIVRIVEYSYQVYVKEEEKLARKKNQRNKGKGPSRGK
jgi:hypothetical protein